MHDYTTSWGGGGGFPICNKNFWEGLEGQTHEHYHSVGLAQAHPNKIENLMNLINKTVKMLIIFTD